MNLEHFWNFVIARVGDRPFTVGTVATAVAAIVAGYFAARVLSRALARLLRWRGRMEEGAAAAVETLGFYFLFVVFSFTSLTLVDFPMTVFTLAGGAVALGVGFGSQQVMRNLISGMILHLERPIRIGDLIEVEGTHGKVEAIGTRSTRIRSVSNTHMILPNSFFLDNTVVNYTLSDDILRTSVRVGVAYGSPTREVERILGSVVEAQEGVLADPQPRIVFADFGDSALIFDVYFWLRAKAIIDRRMVESGVRHRIDEALREAGVTIAFPQRDVHLDAAGPIEVRVLGNADSGHSADSPARSDKT